MGPELSILVIDDDPLILQYLRDVLTHHGYEVLEAVDGRAGLKLYESSRPALVMLDILLPERDGIDCLHEIRKLDPGAIVFTMTGGDWGASDSRNARLLGARRSFIKPIDAAELLAAVREELSASP